MQYVWANFKEYERYEPGGGKYSTHQGYGRRNRYYYGSYDTNYLTKDSRKDWRNRTDMATGALYRLRSGLIELYRLDRDGKKLGIERDSQARFKEFLKGAAGKEVEYSPRAIYDWAGREIARLEAGRSRKYR
ncbi:MAG: hypothetical protein MI741_03770, partial [Rhodospirillales bacterium]|nr:hypothetical protein [Rhodospirillales bacterium]